MRIRGNFGMILVRQFACDCSDTLTGPRACDDRPG